MTKYNNRVFVTLVLLCVCAAIDPLEHTTKATKDEASSFVWIFAPQRIPYKTCGGTIIDKRWVLTAAHCMPIKMARSAIQYNLKIAYDVGRVDYDGIPPQNTISVDGLVVHSDYSYYDGKATYRDIMLLHLASDIPLGTVSNRPTAAEVPDHPPTQKILNDGLRLIGWGGANNKVFWGNNKFRIPKKLRTAILRPLFYGANTCSQKSAADQKSINNVVWDAVICGGADTENQLGPGQGDSGGPYMHRKVDGTDVIYAIVSGRVGHVYVDTAVHKYHQWIQSVMNNYGGNLGQHAVLIPVSYPRPPVGHFQNAIDADHWGNADGCHCNIQGAAGHVIPQDPDCKWQASQDKFGREVNGCTSERDLCVNNQCVTVSAEDWWCDIRDFGDGMKCTKYCGVMEDPDCEIYKQFAKFPKETNEYGNQACSGADPHMLNVRKRAGTYACEYDRCCLAEHMFGNACGLVSHAHTCASKGNHKWPRRIGTSSWGDAKSTECCDTNWTVGTVHKCSVFCGGKKKLF